MSFLSACACTTQPAGTSDANANPHQETYSLNLAEYNFISPAATSRLLTNPHKMGFYDSTNDTRFFWLHLPANKKLQVELDELRMKNEQNSISIIVAGLSVGFSVYLTNTQFAFTKSSNARYHLLFMYAGNQPQQQTIGRLGFSFVD